MSSSVAVIGDSMATIAAENRVQADLARLRETAGKIVGSVFFGTMLKTMRESPLKGRYGHGGRGEEVFAGQLHSVFAERAGAGGRLGDELFQRLQHQQTLISRARGTRDDSPVLG